ncbi:MAG TPA: ABC transporter permease [Stellaceae bacterium]|nr:ABC transporter permease [Stellaceae bacterium]
MALTLAWRNLAQDRIRFATTLAGVAFSVVLMAAQLALLLGFTATSSSLIDHANADFWVAAVGARNVDQSGDLRLHERYRALAVPGVATAASLVVRFAPWKRPDGGTETVIVVGVDLQHPGLQPWNFAAGNVDDLRWPDGIVIDRLYAQKLGVHALGDTVEIYGHRARVVGFTHGIRTFTQAPYVFASVREAQRLTNASPDTGSYLLVSAEPGADLGALHRALAAQFPSLDVWSASGFSWQTRSYWLFSTGAGAALVLAAVLGLIVGMIIVAQTLYASTMERLSEFATLRAMGAPANYLYGIILQQGLMSAAIGFAIGLSVAQTIVHAAHDANAAMLLPLPLVAGLGVATVAMCAGAAVTSIRRAVRAEPAMIFR